jgi:D-sedoheptulose 7-phosphate isomerase
MTTAAPARVDELIAARTEANARFFAAEADRLARLCRRMAERFGAGGRLVASGGSAADQSDVRHVAVEFVHPVIVGKRALPALGVAAADVELTLEPEDIVVAFGDGGVTVADWAFRPPTDDPFVRQELVETLYHVLWELVHVFLDHLDRRSRRGTGASTFLYPFLAEGEADVDTLIEDVRGSIGMKAQEIGALREQTLTDGRDALIAAAADLRACLDAGGRALALGNGGSATDAMDAVADLRHPPPPWPARRAIDLCEDCAILTAVANDVGVESIFSRQVIAYGHPGDVLLAFSTSGNSANVLAALEEARRRGLRTVALVGYDGGRVAAEGLADHVVVTRSQHIPRIQEAQASAWHVLRELVELA